MDSHESEQEAEEDFRLLPIKTEHSSDEGVSVSNFPSESTDSYRQMGENPEANDYDEGKVGIGPASKAKSQIFLHLVFYMDTPVNAKKNGLADSSPSDEASDRSDLDPYHGTQLTELRLAEAARLLTESGGRIITDIQDRKLTHIVMDDDDSGRYAELVRKTAQYVQAGKTT